MHGYGKHGFLVSGALFITARDFLFSKPKRQIRLLMQMRFPQVHHVRALYAAFIINASDSGEGENYNFREYKGKGNSV